MQCQGLITKLISILALLIVPSIALSADFSGKVVSISDGDTITVLSADKLEHRVRLAAIDAPEKAQAFGQRAKQAISDLCYGKDAQVKVIDIDRYNRSVGEVRCAGVYANEAMLSKGMAWVYRKYAKGYGGFYSVEEEARTASRGLWVDSEPMPPWEWRKARRSEHTKQR